MLTRKTAKLELISQNKSLNAPYFCDPARQATLPYGSFWRAKLTTSDDLCKFSTHVTTFRDLCTTLTTNGDNFLTTLKTNDEDTSTTLMTTGEDSSTTALGLVTTL
jgi:hypothetical protein